MNNVELSALGPSHLGPYSIVRPLGCGGMASVYEAVHIGLGKRVAIKVLHPQLARDETTSARFVREGRAAAKIRHPHVVDVMDVGTHEGAPYLVMELLEGKDLAQYLKERGRLPSTQAVDILLPVISAVAAAHQAGIVHRDLKPANVLVSTDRLGRLHPTVVDFGISTFVEKDGDLNLTSTDTLLGTIKYMSPEQTRGAKYADARSDQYSLGVLLYLCITGVLPYPAEGLYESIHAIRHALFTPPSRVAPGLPAELDAILERALHREPAKRYSSVAEFGRALAPFASSTAYDWEREFVALESDHPLNAPAPAAFPASDEATSMASVSAPLAPRTRPLALPLAVVAALVALGFVALAATRAKSAAVEPIAPAGQATSSVIADPAPKVSAVVGVPSPAASVLPPARAISRAVAPKSPPAKRASAASPSSASSSPAPVLGRNEAPILE